jgi:pentapeptide repeat protein
LQGADLGSAALQGAILSYAKLQGANLRGAQLQGADLRFAQLEGADLEGASLLDADLEGVQLQGAVLSGAEIWLAKFPRALAEQSPTPLGVADVKLSAPTLEAKAQLKQGIETDITDPELRGVVLARLDKILSNEPLNWDDATAWEDYMRSAKTPSPLELAAFHAKLACEDAGGAVTAAMAARAKDFEAEHFGKGYAKPLAEALLAETCQGGKALSAETRAALQSLAQAPE